MKLKVDISPLERARESIGAPKSDVRIALDEDNLPKPGPFKRTTRELPDLTAVERGPGDIIIHEGKQFVLYIMTPYEDVDSLSEIPAGKTRFHLVFCQTLENMKREDRYERYVVTDERHGNFNIHPYDKELKAHGKEMQARLGPCKHCLRHLNYNGYADAGWAGRKEIFENFSLEEFFEKYETQIPVKPKHSHLSSPENNYTPDWDKTSTECRRKHNWQCSCCEAFFRENKPLLHTHHKDGNKRNNISSNLIPLCAACHTKQPGHERMGISASDKRAIEKIRQAQGLDKTCPNCP